MSRKQIDLEQLLDETLSEIRDDRMSEQDEQAIGDRVWEQVREEAAAFDTPPVEARQIRDCEDFQALIPAYLQGALNRPKALLFEDHVGECFACRKALKQARQATRSRRASGETAGSRSGWISTAGWRVAAVAAIFLVVMGLSVQTDVFKLKAGGLIHIDAVDGELFRVTDEGSVPVVEGAEFTLNRGEELRTAKGSRAMLRLSDDSLVEMKERSELAVIEQSALWNRKQSDRIIELERGSVIIEASDQGSGHLFVDTADSRTAVTGTVFSVNHGIKGTRVSVIEGEVHVEHTGSNDILHPGQQVTTRAALQHVPLEQEIAWSLNAEQHIQLLRAVTELGRELDEVLQPGLRYSTNLLDRAPADTVIYVGVPNVADSLAEAHDVLQQKISSSEALQQWWDENAVASGADRHLAEIIDRIQAWGEHFGEEIALTMSLDDNGEPMPIVMAGLSNASGFRSFLEQELAQLDDRDAAVRVFEGSVPNQTEIGVASDRDNAIDMWIRDDLLAVTFDRTMLGRLSNELQVQERGGALVSPFKERLHDMYDNGVEWVVGADVATILDTSLQRESGPGDKGRESMRELGLLDMEYLLAERKTTLDRTENRVDLTFSQERRGLAAWLDEPAPMGALDFISPDASLAAGFVMQDPATLVDELFEKVGSLDPEFLDHLAEFESENGIDIRNDFAAPLGGEFAFAIDGPVLPSPSWKLILEVYDPVQLQNTVEWAMEQMNAEAEKVGKQGFRVSSEETDHEWHQIESLDTGISVHYVFADGYLIAGPSRVMLQRALSIKDSQVTLTGSSAFLSLLPVDGEVNFSGVVYQNLGMILGPVVKLGSAATDLPPDQQRILEEMANQSKPSMTLAYGAPDRIAFVFTHEGGLISSGLASFFSFKSLTNVQEWLGQTVHQEAHNPARSS